MLGNRPDKNVLTINWEIVGAGDRGMGDIVDDSRSCRGRKSNHRSDGDAGASSPSGSGDRPLKLVIQIPCYNEEQTLPQVLRDLPNRIAGVDRIEVQVIDDGSSDETAAVARRLGVDHIVINKSNRGLAHSFQKGINNALAEGADIIVNTDGDNQYDGSSIADLVLPILEGRADVVIGDRNPGKNPDFSSAKRVLQKVGSFVVKSLSGVDIDDAVSGFRAYSREAALKINVMTRFSYTTETLIQAGQHGLTVLSVPVRTNPVLRPSRLFRSIPGFLSKQALTIVRSWFMYRPLRAFLTLGLFMMLIGAGPILRFLYYFVIGEGAGKIQSLTIGSLFVGMGYVTVVVAFLSDAVATNRRLLEESLERLRDLDTHKADRQ